MNVDKPNDHLNELKRLAYESYYALQRRDLNSFGELLHQAWEMKKARNPQIATPEIDHLYDLALQNGALGGRLAGSGGGYGFDRISELGKQIETLSLAGDAAGVAARLAELKDYIENLEIVYE